MTIKTGTIKKIPKHLIYEMDEGVPIYYKGYKEYLNGNQNFEQTMPDSNLQAWLKGRLYLFISLLFQKNKNIVVTVGEQGLSLKKRSWRGADIAIFKKSNFDLVPEYSKKPPEVVIEINIKGDYDSDEKMLRDYERKNAQLLEFGVKKIIWIFTETQFIVSVTNEGKKNYEWNDDVPVFKDISFNVQKVVDSFYE
ncbi:MAG TPA: Uma2 family endonuclease [Bacteroidetes bacterium]|nr:Uma2 family endonuclease [Bacteroidota bacterium]